jgi:uncharacterized membrane protein
MGLVAVLSIALNLFLAGNMVGHRFRDAPPPPLILEERLDAMLRELPVKDQATVRAIIARRRDDIMDKWRALRSGNRAIGDAVKADPFVPEQAEAAFQEADRRSAEFRKAMQQTTLEIASQISPEGRKQLHVPGTGF